LLSQPNTEALGSNTLGEFVELKDMYGTFLEERRRMMMGDDEKPKKKVLSSKKSTKNIVIVDDL